MLRKTTQDISGVCAIVLFLSHIITEQVYIPRSTSPMLFADTRIHYVNYQWNDVIGLKDARLESVYIRQTETRFR